MNIYVRSKFSVGDKMSRSDGMPSGGLYGTIKSIEAVAQRTNAVAIHLCFESGGTRRRQELHAEYKADRVDGKSHWQDRSHRPALAEWAQHSGYKCSYGFEVEADDIIAELTLQSNTYERVAIMSQDHDFFRLLGQNVFMLRDNGKTLYDEQSFITEHSFPVEYYDLFQSLIGDSSDNVKGVPRIGPKRAFKVMYDCDFDEDRVRKHPLIAPHLDIVDRNVELLTFKRVPVINIAGKYDPIKLDALYEEWEFSSLRRGVLS